MTAERRASPAALPPRPAQTSYPDPRLHPWSGFSLAATAAVGELHRQSGLDLWLVTRLDDELQVVVASAGPWADRIAPGRQLSWAASFCRQMVDRRGPTLAPDVLRVPAYAAVATGEYTAVRGYLGVPLEGQDGRTFGTLCAFSGQVDDQALCGAQGGVQLVARLLSTVLAHEELAAGHAREAAQAWAAAELDQLTGLRNRRGWETALLLEDARSQKRSTPVSVLALDADDLKQINDKAGHAAGDELLMLCAEVLRCTSRPGDALARVGGDEFSLLAVECDAPSARALLARLRVHLRTAGVAASAGAATRRPGESLPDTWKRADRAMYRNKQHRKQRAAA